MPVLEKKHTISIIIALYKMKSFEIGKAYQLTLKRFLNHKSESIKYRLVELKQEKLIDYESVAQFQHKEYIWLTPKGKRIAEKLLEIEEILKEK